jgi:hypothetical protein
VFLLWKKDKKETFASCPDTFNYNPFSKLCSCPELSTINKNSNKCECDNGLEMRRHVINFHDEATNEVIPIKSNICSCPHRLLYDINNKQCRCPGGLVFNNENQNCECPKGFKFDKQKMKCVVDLSYELPNTILNPYQEAQERARQEQARIEREKREQERRELARQQELAKLQELEKQSTETILLPPSSLQSMPSSLPKLVTVNNTNNLAPINQTKIMEVKPNDMKQDNYDSNEDNSLITKLKKFIFV